MSSSIAKIFQRFKSGPKLPQNGIYLSWPSIPSKPRQQPRQFPLQVPSLVHPQRTSSILESTYYLVAPKQRGEQQWKPWIARVEEVDATTWRLLNPLLSPLVMGQMGNPRDYLIKELARSYTLVNIVMEAKKVVSIPSTTTTKMALLALDWKGQLAVWNEGGANWRLFYNPFNHPFSDIASYKGKFYAIDKVNGVIFEINPTTYWLQLICRSEEIKSYRRTGYYYGSDSLIVYNERLYATVSCGDEGHQIITSHELNEIVVDGEQTKRKIVKSLQNDVLFIFDEASFTIPSYLLDRKFQGYWICYSSNSSNKLDTSARGDVDSERMRKFRVLEALERMKYWPFGYLNSFSKCYLNFEQNPLYGKVIDFGNLPRDEYVTLFYPPPSWIPFYCLDAEKGYPQVRFDQ